MVEEATARVAGFNAAEIATDAVHEGGEVIQEAITGHSDRKKFCRLCGVEVSGGGDVCDSCSQPVAKSKPSVSIEADEETWSLIKDSTDAADVEFYLENFPNGKYAIPAKLKLKQLQR